MKLATKEELNREYNMRDHYIFQLIVERELTVYIENLPDDLSYSSFSLDDRLAQVPPKKISYRSIKYDNGNFFFKRCEVEKSLNKHQTPNASARPDMRIHPLNYGYNDPNHEILY